MLIRNILENPVFITQRALHRCLSTLLREISFEKNDAIWLDVGCGEKPYKNLFDKVRYVGMEVLESGNKSVSKRHDLLYDGKRFPIRSEAVEGVICTQVLEHVPEPTEIVLEMYRVLEPGGCLILTAPFIWEEHEQPYDFMRFSSYGIRSLLEGAGFRIVAYRKTSGSVEALSQMLSVYLSGNLHFGIPGWSRIVNALLCAPIQLLGCGLQRILPDKKGLFLDSVVVAVKQ